MFIKRRRGRRRKFSFKIRRGTVYSALSLALFLAAGISFLSFFAEGTLVKEFLQPYLSRFLGWATFFLPPVLGLSGLILSRAFSHKLVQPRILLGLVGLMICAASIFDYFSPSSGASLLGEGGGWVGLTVKKYLVSFAGQGGTILILSICAAGFLMITLNLSFKQISGFFGKNILPLVKKLQKVTAVLFARLASRKNLNKIEEDASSQENKQTFLDNDFTSLAAQDVKNRKEDSSTGPLQVEILSPSFSPIILKDKNKEASQFSLFSAPVPPSPAAAVPPVIQEKPKRIPKIWQYPPLDLLTDSVSSSADRGDIKQNAAMIEVTLESFGIKVRVVEVNSGPSVTQYVLQAAEGTKIAKIMNLQNDIALALASPTGSVRVEAPIPGRSLIGVELPNNKASIVDLKGILSSPAFRKDRSMLLVGLGLDVAGAIVTSDLGKMPHVLIAGQTGSGKSIMLHAFLLNLLFRRSPEEVRLILVDPKRVEMPLYSGIPHLLTPVITSAEEAISPLKWAVSEMEKRYKLFEKAKVRDLAGYNEFSGFQALPYIVIVVDELASLMVVAPVEMEKNICRLAQMSRATGVHLVLATQRPSVNVLTGLIKANIPCRISFSVASLVDSRVILDQSGAEKLLGKGDMLYVPPTSSKPMRVQGAFVSPSDIKKVVQFLRDQEYQPLTGELLFETENITGFGESESVAGDESLDSLFPDALEVVVRARRASASLLQRRLSIGYARAARLIDQLEMLGAISTGSGSKPRDVLVDDSEMFLKRLNG